MSLAWKILKTDWRSGELQLLFAALFLAVVVVTGLTAFIDRLQIMLVGESSQFLAADRSLDSPRPIDQQWHDKAKEFGLKNSQHLVFQSMLYAQDQPQLVSVKAADDNYPLRGQLKYRKALDDKILATKFGPKVGEIWAEERLLHGLHLQLGDRVSIGDAEFILKEVLVSEPDRGAGFFTMGPRVLMHWDDIGRTGVVALGSRLSYNYLYAGNSEAIASYEKWLLPKLSDSQKWLDLENTQPTVFMALFRAKNFFLLASSIVVILASIAIGMASARFSQLHVKHVAVLKTLGATSNLIQNIYIKILLLLMSAAVFMAWVTAFFVQEIIIRQVEIMLDVEAPAMTIWPFLLGLATAFISLLTFALPPIIELKKIPAVKIFQLDTLVVNNFSKTSLSVGFVGLLLILVVYTNNLLLGSLLLISIALLCLIVAIPTSWILLRLGKVKITASGWFTLALSNIKRRFKTNAIHTAVFAMSLMLLVILLGIKDNLFVEWQDQLPDKTPNYFLVNIQEHDLPKVEKWFIDKSVTTEHIYPMVRGRLVEINHELVRTRVSKEKLGKAGADRELNLSWAEELPSDNKIVSGDWWNAKNNQEGVSVEEKLAENLGIKVGDILTFMIAAERFDAKVASIRSVEWDRMKPNFYMLFTEKQLVKYPKTFMTSFWIPDERHKEVMSLSLSFPTTIVIELDSLIKQIRSIIQHVSIALELVLFFVLIGSLLVMSATVQSSLSERIRENTMIRALGGTRQLIAGSLIAEFAFIGLFAGILATFGAELILLLLQSQVMKTDIQFHPSIWWVAPLLGSVLIGLAGFLSAYRVLKTVPMQLLRSN